MLARDSRVTFAGADAENMLGRIAARISVDRLVRHRRQNSSRWATRSVGNEPPTAYALARIR